MSRPSVETARGWQAKPVVGRDGEPLGRITHIYIDRSTGEPTWALVARGKLARKEAFVPLALASDEGDQVRVLVAATAVEEAPHVKGGGELSGDDEVRLSEHYGEPTGAPSTRSGARRGFLGGQPDLGEPGVAPEWANLPARGAGARRPSRARRLIRMLSVAAFVGGAVMMLRSRQRGGRATPRPAGGPMGPMARGRSARRMGPPMAGPMGRRMGRPAGHEKGHARPHAKGRAAGRTMGPMAGQKLGATVAAGSKAARKAVPKAAMRRKRSQRARPGRALLRRVGVPVAVMVAAMRARGKRRSASRSRQVAAGMRRQRAAMRQMAAGMRRQRAAMRRRKMTPAMPSMPSVSMPSLSMPSRSSYSRRRSRKMTGKLRLVVGFAAGYVLGAKAGRERYEQIMHQVKDLWERPEVQNIATKGRETIGQGAQRGAGVATERMERVRSSMSSGQQGSGGPDPARGDPAAKASGNDDPQRQRPSSMPKPDGEDQMQRDGADAMRRQGKQPPSSPA
jgi:PRC-barrel domain